jgi:MSHA pilin protein MshC
MFRASNNRGFTIVELVVVIIILGIISAVAAPRFFDLQDYKELAFKDELVSALRFAQKRAVASGCDIRVEIGNFINRDGDIKNGFILYRHKSISMCGKSVPDPEHTNEDMRAEIVLHPAGGDFTNEEPPYSIPDKTIVFDALGRAKITDQNPEIDINNEGSGIIIWRETGCVEVN